MQFPPTRQTARTEAFMAAWRKQNPDATTSAYNSKFTETYNRFGSDPDAGEKDPELSAREARRYHVIEREARPVTVTTDDVTEAKEAAYRREFRRPKHKPQTKGAFGGRRR